MKVSPRKTKGEPNEEFEAARNLWRMEFAFHTFQAVLTGIKVLLESKRQSNDPEYYPLTVGLICLYARPFTGNRPVGPLSEEIVPSNYLDLHQSLIALRHKLFAHSDVSALTRPDDYPNELVVYNDGKKIAFTMTRFFAEPEFFKLTVPLVEELIEKTRYHSRKLRQKFKRHFGSHKNVGQFRLNVVDPAVPIFTKLKESEIAVREETIWMDSDETKKHLNENE